MERYRITERRAFEFLTRTSSTGNIKLREVAAELVEATERTHEPTGTPGDGQAS